MKHKYEYRMLRSDKRYAFISCCKFARRRCEEALHQSGTNRLCRLHASNLELMHGTLVFHANNAPIIEESKRNRAESSGENKFDSRFHYHKHFSPRFFFFPLLFSSSRFRFLSFTLPCLSYPLPSRAYLILLFLISSLRCALIGAIPSNR